MPRTPCTYIEVQFLFIGFKMYSYDDMSVISNACPQCQGKFIRNPELIHCHLVNFICVLQLVQASRYKFLSVLTGETFLQDRSTNFPTLYYRQDPNKCWLKCSQVALILPLLLWAGNPETKTVTACVEQYAALELLYLNPKQASASIEI